MVGKDGLVLRHQMEAARATNPPIASLCGELRKFHQMSRRPSRGARERLMPPQADFVDVIAGDSRVPPRRA
jgi:hypothetical protein